MYWSSCCQAPVPRLTKRKRRIGVAPQRYQIHSALLLSSLFNWFQLLPVSTAVTCFICWKLLFVMQLSGFHFCLAYFWHVYDAICRGRAYFPPIIQMKLLNTQTWIDLDKINSCEVWRSWAAFFLVLWKGLESHWPRFSRSDAGWRHWFLMTEGYFLFIILF